MHVIDVNDQTAEVKEKHINLIKKVLQYTLEHEKIMQQTEVAVTIVTNEQIKQLNKTYRNIDEATDVLSFEIDNPYVQSKQSVLHVGDIVISHDKVMEQATRYNHSYERELAFLAVHGMLHLLGYTHDDKEQEKTMFAKQERILEEFELER
ncbi:MAG TPA: rRNA maturation RNase YbeY [Pseudogracilibacillus sp.]|nr:rRNA maturation RNase YbeY [Pseudogracilibacillus sp.]